MNKKALTLGAILLLAACGDDDDPETSSGFLRGPLPSEATLCSLEMGVATVTQAQTVLAMSIGEPTEILSADGQTNLTYYWGSTFNATAMMLLSFDEEDRLETALLQNIPFPQCWQDQLDAIEAREAADFD